MYFEIKRLGLLALLSSVIIRCSSNNSKLSSKLYRIFGRADDQAMQSHSKCVKMLVIPGAADIYHIIDIRYSIVNHVFLSQ